MLATLIQSIINPIKTGCENRFVIRVFLVQYRYNIDFIKTLLTLDSSKLHHTFLSDVGYC